MINRRKIYDYCECEKVTDTYIDDDNEFSHWEVCCKCDKEIEGTRKYFNHYDGEDHDED